MADAWHPCRLVFQKTPPVQLRAGIGGGEGWNCRGTSHKEHRRSTPNQYHGQSCETGLCFSSWHLSRAPERGTSRRTAVSVL